MKKKEPSLEEKITSLPSKSRFHNWTPEMDRLLLKFIPDKGVPAVAGILRIPVATVQNRYRKLKMSQK
jgi:hypothetical protein